MLDIQIVRDNPELVKQKAAQKGYEVDIGKLLELDAQRTAKLQEVEALRAERNEISSQMKGGKPDPKLIEKGKQIKQQLFGQEDELEKTEAQRLALLKTVPNLPVDDVPVGTSEEENVVVKEWGDKPDFDFAVKSHWEIGQSKGWIDKERAAKVAGARFVYLKGDLVLMEQALWSFGYSVLTNSDTLQQIIDANGLDVSNKAFMPVLPPAAARKDVFEATGRLNKEEQTYKIEDEDLWLNASAEHTLAPMYLDEILDEQDLPLRYVGYTTAFRREAGTYGKDVEGILRLHQFNKLEMECFNLSENSLNEHLFLVAIQEYLMQQLGLPYRLLNKCTADIGFPNARGMDIDVWLPSQETYRETHTADYISDFQAQGMRTRVRRKDGSLQLAHTNDATAFSQRPLIAIIENFQTPEGDVVVPEVLRKFMGGRDII